MGHDDRGFENRLGVLEAVLGIDSLAAEECEGDPVSCSGPCKQNACPMKNHALVRLERALNTISAHQRTLRHLIKELEASPLLPAGTWDRAVAQAEMEQMETHLQEVTDTLHKIEAAGIVGVLLEEASRRKALLEEDVSRARARLS